MKPRPADHTERSRSTELTIQGDPDGTWEIARARPAAFGAAGIHGFRGHRLRTGLTRRRLEVPNGTVTLVILFDDPIRLADASDHPAEWGVHRAFVTGPRTRATLGEHDGRLSGVEVLLDPWMAHRVLDLPMHELAGTHQSLPDLLGRSARALSDRLAEAPTWSQRFGLLDAFLAARCANGPEPDPRVVWAWRELQRTGGRVTARRLAEGTGWGARQLESRFRHEIGLPPKSAARVLRLQRALHLLTRGHRPTQVAALCGFYDQAHLNRDFKAMTGRTPRQFLLDRTLLENGPVPIDRVDGQVTSAVLPS